MLRKLKSVLKNEITADTFVKGMAMRSAMFGGGVNVTLPSVDFSGVVKKYGTPTRIFRDTRDDN